MRSHEHIDEAILELQSLAECDCYEESYDVYKDHNTNLPECDCSPCRARRAIERLRIAKGEEFETAHPERLAGNVGERVFLSVWREENLRRLKRGQWSYLEEILRFFPYNHSTGKRGEQYESASPEVIKAVTTFVQWLGTNCGCGFIDQCKREIAKQSGLHFESIYSHAPLEADKPEDYSSLFDVIAITIVNIVYPIDTERWGRQRARLFKQMVAAFEIITGRRLAPQWVQDIVKADTVRTGRKMRTPT